MYRTTIDMTNSLGGGPQEGGKGIQQILGVLQVVNMIEDGIGLTNQSISDIVPNERPDEIAPTPTNYQEEIAQVKNRSFFEIIEGPTGNVERTIVDPVRRVKAETDKLLGEVPKRELSLVTRIKASNGGTNKQEDSLPASKKRCTRSNKRVEEAFKKGEEQWGSFTSLKEKIAMLKNRTKIYEPGKKEYYEQALRRINASLKTPRRILDIAEKLFGKKGQPTCNTKFLELFYPEQKVKLDFFHELVDLLVELDELTKGSAFVFSAALEQGGLAPNEAELEAPNALVSGRGIRWALTARDSFARALPTKKSTSEMKDNSLVLNINYSEEETTNEDFQWLEPNSTTASSMFPEARTLPELLKIGVRVELDKESCEEVYAERSLKAQEQEEGDQQQNDYWDVVLDKNLRNSRDTSSPFLGIPYHSIHFPSLVEQI